MSRPPFIRAAAWARLLANGQAATDGADRDPLPVVKLFTPDANATWLLTEVDPVEPDRAFGLCDLGLGCPELGYVSLTELTSVRGVLRLSIEADDSFVAGHPLSAYAAAARAAQRIVQLAPNSPRQPS